MSERFNPAKRRHFRLADAHEAQDPAVLLVNAAERALLEKLKEKGGKCYRQGWPDFLLETKGKPTIAIEVKAGADNVSDVQAKMFGALERSGLKVFVWNPRIPDRLFPWRLYLERGAKALLTDREFGTEKLKGL